MWNAEFAMNPGASIMNSLTRHAGSIGTRRCTAFTRVERPAVSKRARSAFTLVELPAVSRRARSAFTLVELLVVIAIIIILIGIGLGIIEAVANQGEKQLTRMVFATLESAATEYYTATGQTINHQGVAPFNWGEIRRHNFPRNDEKTGYGLKAGDNAGGIQSKSIARFVWVTYKMEQIRSLYATLDPSVFNHIGSDNDGDGRVDEDPYGNAFEDDDGDRNYNVDDDDNDGDVDEDPIDGFITILDGWGNKFVYVSGVQHVANFETGDDFLPEHDGVFFASPGPDGKWGSVNFVTNVPNEDAQDNLYSFSQD
jgi:type II secretory pathway pseudopilin PulG